MKDRCRRSFNEFPMGICFGEVTDQDIAIASFFDNEWNMTYERLIILNGDHGRKRVLANERENFAFIFDFESLR